MSDRITVTGIRARGFHGVLPEERTMGQFFTVDVVLHLDLSPAGASDDLAHTVNYDAVARGVVADIEGEPLDLIEALAERIAARILADALVREVEVTVHKPHAPVGVCVSGVSVTIHRPAPDRGLLSET